MWIFENNFVTFLEIFGKLYKDVWSDTQLGKFGPNLALFWMILQWADE